MGKACSGLIAFGLGAVTAADCTYAATAGSPAAEAQPTAIVGEWKCQGAHFIFLDNGQVTIPTKGDVDGKSAFDRSFIQALGTYELTAQNLKIHLTGRLVTLAAKDLNEIPAMIRTGVYQEVRNDTVRNNLDLLNFITVRINGEKMIIRLTRSIDRGVDVNLPDDAKAPDVCQRSNGSQNISGTATPAVHKESAQELRAELFGADTAYNEAQRTGRPTEELMGRASTIEMKLQLMADMGHPIACVVTALHYNVKLKVEHHATDCRPHEVLRDYREMLKYARCAAAKRDMLSVDDRGLAERMVDGVPRVLAAIEPPYAADDTAGSCYKPNL
jgi:hypothetical protein